MNLHVWLCGRCHHVFDEKEEADECCLDEVDETAESVQAEMFIESDGLVVAVEGLDGTYLTDGEIKIGYTSASEAGFEPKELKTVMWVWDDIEGYGAYLATEQITFLSESFGAESSVEDSICPCECGGIIAEHDDRGYGVWECPQCGEDSDVDLGEICSVCWDKEDFASVILAPEETTGPMQQALMTNYLIRKSILEEKLRYLHQEVINGRMSRKQMAFRLMELENRLRAEEDPKAKGTITYMKGVPVKPRKLNGDLPPEIAMKRTDIGRKNPEPFDVEWDSTTKPSVHDPFNEVEWDAEGFQRGRQHKVGRQIVEECVDIRGSKADVTTNFYRVRFRDPKDFDNFRVPEWAARAANTIGLKYYDVQGSKITMGLTINGKWKIQSVMIPKRSDMEPEQAIKIANHIQDRLEREGRWANKECLDQERILIVG